MNDANQKTIEEKFKNLPQDLQDALFSEDISTKIKAVAKRHGLSVEQLGEFYTATSDVVLGLIHPRDYISELSKKLNVGIDVAKDIAKEVNEQIFAPIRDSLKKIHGIKEEGAPATLPTTPQSAPAAKSPFEQKLEEKVFKPAERPLVKEVEEAKKENRYPSSEDPYREPSK